MLDEELSRLPLSWQAPLLLCYLEGRTQDEAARQLGWSKSTFKAGDQVTFTGNAAKSGSKIMRLRKVVFPTGKEMMIDRGEDYAE